MSFNNEDEKNDGAPPIFGKPGGSFKKTSVFGRPPAFSKAAGSIMERLKNLSKKDMAFVAVGMSVLVMAPVAEYMMSKPSGADQLTPGFGSRADSGAPLYEPGINALSQGSPDGSGDVITPLSSRDPASLIVGAQPAQPPAAPAMNNAPSTSFRDSMKDSAQNAFSAASKSAGVPTVIPKMQSALRGMSSFFSGGEGTRTTGTLGGGKILEDAKNASGKAASRSMVGPVASAGYKGVSSSPNSSSKGAFEKLRGQADKAAGSFNGGSAISSLDKAAAESMDAGKGAGGLGAGGVDEKNKAPSNSSVRDTKNNSGETLDQMAAKQRMQKALEWEFYKQYEIPKKILEAALTGFTGKLTDFVGDMTKSALGMNDPPGGKCWVTSICNTTRDCYNIALRRYGDIPGSVLKLCAAETATEKVFKSGGKDSSSGHELDCPCGTQHDNPYPKSTTTVLGAGTDSVKPDTSAGGGGSGGAAAPKALAGAAGVVVGNYDDILKQILIDVEEGSKTKDAAKLLEHTMLAAGGFSNLRVGDVVQTLKNSVLKTRQTEIAAYERKVQEAGTSMAAVKSEYGVFKAKFESVAQAAKEGKLASGAVMSNGVSMSADISREVLPYLDQTAPELKEAEARLSAVEKDIAEHRKAAEVYVKQTGYVTSSAEAVAKEYAEVLKSAQEITAELQPIKDAGGTQTPEQRELIVKHFKAISGIDPALIPGETARVKPADPVLLAMYAQFDGEYRDAVGEKVDPAEALAGNSLLDSAFLWRGLPKTDPYDKAGKANDSRVVADEQAAWAAVSPLKKFGNMNEIQDINNLAKSSLVSAAIRGEAEIPGDVNGISGHLSVAVGGLASVKEKMTEVKTKLAAYKINLDDTAGSQASSEEQAAPGAAQPEKPAASQPPASAKPIAAPHQVSSEPPAKPVVVPLVGAGGAGSAAVQPAAASVRADGLSKSAYATHLDMIAQLGSAGGRYEAVANSGKCVSRACRDSLAAAKGNQIIMIQNSDEMSALRQELKNKPVSQARLDQIEARLNQIGRNMDAQNPQSYPRLFDSNMKEAARLAKTAATAAAAPSPKPRAPRPAQTPAPAEPAKPKVEPKPELKSEAKAEVTIDGVQLVKGRTTIPAYDQQGNKVYGEKCVKWGWGLKSTFTGEPVCTGKERGQVTVQVNDYYLAYDNPKGENIPLTAHTKWDPVEGTHAIYTSDGVAYYQDPSVKRQEYELEVKIGCVKGANGWVIKYAGMRKGTAARSDRLGGRISGGWDLGAQLTADISYDRTWSQYSHGEMLNYSSLVGKPCK